ncbi:MAG: glutamate-1-semialdehyde 2,1-aminomutase [Bacteriovoracia bacterium]
MTASKTVISELLFERAKKVIPGGVHSPVRSFRSVGGVPRFIASGRGPRIQDVDGNEYLDFSMSWGPLIFGHCDEEIASAAHQAIELGSSFGAAEKTSLELAEYVTSRIPWIDKIRFVNSGTEAVMSALRIARGATNRNKVLKFEGCYHGHVDSLLVKAGSGLADAPSPDSAGITKAQASDTVCVPLNDIQALNKAFDVHGKDIAAIILEPVPANNGLLVQENSFIEEAARLARKHGALVIYDEVITGFRVDFEGMTSRLQVKPDLVTYGKILGGGFPVGAYGGKKEWMDLVAPIGPVYQAGTLSANSVAMAAGLATLRKLEREKPYRALAQKTEELSRKIEATAKENGHNVQVQNYESMFWMSFSEKKPIRAIHEISSQQKEQYSRLFHVLLDKGFYLAPSGYEVSFLSTTHADRDIEHFLSTLSQYFKEGSN